MPRKWRSVLRYMGLIFPTMILDQIVWQRAEIYFLAQLADSRESGYYGLAYSISSLAITVIPMSLTGVLTPVLASLTGSDQDDYSAIVNSYRDSLRLLGLLLFPLAAGVFAIAPSLLLLLFGEEYIAASSVLRLLAISAAVRIWARPSASVMHALNKPGALLMTDLIAVPVDLVLAWQLATVWGAQGAAVANLAAHLVGASVLIAYTMVSTGLSYDYKSIRRTAFSACVCGTVAWLASSLLERSILGIALAVVLGGVAYIFVLIVMGDSLTHQVIIWILTQVRQLCCLLGSDKALTRK